MKRAQSWGSANSSASTRSKPSNVNGNSIRFLSSGVRRMVFGNIIWLGSRSISREMIIEFATEFDPFPFHLDERAANESILGGLAASGWQTVALTLKLLSDVLHNRSMTVGHLGLRNLKWKRPLFVGDTLHAAATVLELSYPGSCAMATFAIEVKNQDQAPIMTVELTSLVKRRDDLSDDGEDVE